MRYKTHVVYDREEEGLQIVYVIATEKIHYGRGDNDSPIAGNFIAMA